MFLNTFMSIFALFIFMISGYFSGKKGYIDDKINEGINKIVLNITFPCSILSSFKKEYNSIEIYRDILILFIIFVIFKSFCLILALTLFKEKKDVHHSSDRFSAVFSNTNYMGMPITKAIFGDKAVIFTSIYVVFSSTLNNTLGILFFKGKADFKGLIYLFLKPAIIAAFIGMILFSFKIDLPIILKNSIGTLGPMTTTLSFMSIGYVLSKSNFNKLFNEYRVYFICGLRLIIIPLCAYFIFNFFIKATLLFNTFVIIESMPVAAVSITYSSLYKPKDLEYMSKVVFLSTLISLLTIPIIATMISK
ncbi:MAG: AEC family transporter [Oscillospiraceae bacterium]|nr:AEC family transporter [Oscillospiraceae bacterium]